MTLWATPSHIGYRIMVIGSVQSVMQTRRSAQVPTCSNRIDNPSQQNSMAFFMHKTCMRVCTAFVFDFAGIASSLFLQGHLPRRLPLRSLSYISPRLPLHSLSYISPRLHFPHNPSSAYLRVYHSLASVPIA
ncbi:hypothetical protein M404DRAFT_998818 [Pisolithus tinctorius Marx 270]|uniref:Uncharacterized protein n=1 Tax=Pisolithus tinctorius Marx 270 TaxID=870435 RepID=A0A0C3P0Q5_PISTI|nr:hypothetical protein M404DRAFT_998818 [Pisolithus tinctorius Marx 270]